jgi:hypothetical protein
MGCRGTRDQVPEVLCVKEDSHNGVMPPLPIVTTVCLRWYMPVRGHVHQWTVPAPLARSAETGRASQAGPTGWACRLCPHLQAEGAGPAYHPADARVSARS